MDIDTLVSNNFIIFYLIFFLIILIISIIYKVKNLVFRFLTLLVLLIMLINPLKNTDKKEFYKDIVFIVSDLSKSVVETKKINQSNSIKEEFIKQLNNIKNIETVEINIKNPNIKSGYYGNEGGTLIFKEIYKHIDYYQKERISGIIIITDGQIHDLQNYKSFLKDIPVHFILTGNKNEKDRILISKNIPNYALIGNKIKFDLKVLDNFNNDKIKVEFSLDGKLVDRKKLLPNKLYNISLPLKHAGNSLLEIKAQGHINEITTLNNKQTHEINGIHDRLRVMLISGEPNMGLRNLRNILNSDPSIELLHFTILRPPSKRDLTPVKELSLIPFPTQELFSADISKFSLIIFDQYSLKGILPPKYLNNISRFVINGGALLDIAGKNYSDDISLINSPIKQILPTRPLKIYNGEKFIPILTTIGERHPITNSLKDNFKNNSWGSWNSFTETSLISGKTLMQFNNFPLLVIDQVGDGRVAQILTDQSWIWKKSEKEKGPLVILLRNTIHWLLKTPRMEEDFLEFEKNEELIKLKLNSLNPGNFQAEIITPSNKKINILLKDNKKGSLEGTFFSNEVGKHIIKYTDTIKYIYVGKQDYKEIEDVRSTDTRIINYFKNIDEKNKKISLFWAVDGIPKVIKIYNDKYFKGNSWIGIIENNVIKEENFSKKSFIDWYYLISALIITLLLTWYKESKN